MRRATSGADAGAVSRRSTAEGQGMLSHLIDVRVAKALHRTHHD